MNKIKRKQSQHRNQIMKDLKNGKLTIKSQKWTREQKPRPQKSQNKELKCRDTNYFNENDTYLFESPLHKFESKVYFENGQWYTKDETAYKCTSIPCVNTKRITQKPLITEHIPDPTNLMPIKTVTKTKHKKVRKNGEWIVITWTESKEVHNIGIGIKTQKSKSIKNQINDLTTKKRNFNIDRSPCPQDLLFLLSVPNNERKPNYRNKPNGKRYIVHRSFYQIKKRF